jgi:hypothetical protein
LAHARRDKFALDNSRDFCDTSAAFSHRKVAVMVVKIVRVAVISLVLVVFLNVGPAVCNGLWPFSSENNGANASRSNGTVRTTNVAATSSQTQPSTLDKIGTGTKDFFTKIGNTVTGKKTQPKKDNSAPVYPKNPLTMQDNDKSWWPSWLRSEEKKPKDVKGFLAGSKRPEIK